MASENEALTQDDSSTSLFLPAWSKYNQPSRIVTLGHYYPERHRDAAQTLVREERAGYHTETSADFGMMRQNLGWTQLIAALNEERKWPLKRLFDILDRMLESGIALAVVPTHLAYQAFWPT